MFCYQCQETVKNKGCTVKGVCGKDEQTANYQDLLIFILKGISTVIEQGEIKGPLREKAGKYIVKVLFTTVTNVNFDETKLAELVEEGLDLKRDLVEKIADKSILPEFSLWDAENESEYSIKAKEVGVLATENEDIRSLRELLIYGLKGTAAYTDHAHILGYEDSAIDDFMIKALAAAADDTLGVNELVQLVLDCGKTGVDAMALLNKANTTTYGNPEPTAVNIGVRNNPGILISGHDLKDLEELLDQTRESGVDVYTHGEMLPANAYPFFKQYTNFAGNYGGSWWKQHKEFESFNGPILMTTNCLIPPLDSYRDRVFTTGLVAYPGVKHIAERTIGKSKDFSEIIEKAKSCESPQELEKGELIGGFGAQTLTDSADAIIDAVSSGAVKRFIVMAGCDGRHDSRSYFTEVAEKLPQDTIILTAGCAKYRYNKLDLGKIGDFPRVIDAGQCNDSYSLALIALTLKEKLGLDDINKLPISFDVAWYEQKAVLVLLALLYLGFKKIRLGPTLPAFLSPNVAKVLVDNFDIKPITSADEDIKAILAGQ
jgi:hydroxylamine reductase